MKESTHIRGNVLRETDKSLLIEVAMISVDPVGTGFVEFTREAWIPKSLAKVDGDGWSIPSWLAKDRGLFVWTAPGSRLGYSLIPA